MRNNTSQHFLPKIVAGHEILFYEVSQEPSQIHVEDVTNRKSGELERAFGPGWARWYWSVVMVGAATGGNVRKKLLK